MQPRMRFDDVAWEESENIESAWVKAILQETSLRAIGQFIVKHRQGIPTELCDPKAGAFNVHFRMKFQDGGSAVIRFPKPGCTMFPEEKIRNEVAVMKYIQDNTSIPVPFILHWGTKEESPLGLGPFIIMKYIDHDTDVGKVLDMPELDWRERPRLDPHVDPNKLEVLYRQLADVLLQLSKLEFPTIGSLEEVDEFTWEARRRPLSIHMNELVRLGTLPRDKLPNETYGASCDYFEALAQLHIDHLKHQRNDAVDSEIDCRRKYIARRLFQGLSKQRKLASSTFTNGPFKLWCDDLRPSNILLDANMQIVEVVDWEFTYAAPAEFSFAPPDSSPRCELVHNHALSQGETVIVTRALDLNTMKGSRKRKPEDERDETTLKRRQLDDSVPACTTHQVEAIVDQPIRREQPDEDGQVIVNYPPTFSAGSFVYERSLTDCTRSVTSSDQEDQEDQERREEESEYYQCRRHVALLRDKNCYMTDSKKGICRESEEVIAHLLSTPAQHSYFRDPNFLEKWKHAPYRNKESVLHHITPELVPSAEARTDRGARKLQWLTESTNEAWSEVKPLIKHRPHPDYSVGFHRQIFTKRDRENMIPVSDRFIVGESSRIMATPLMYFPFLSCDVKDPDALPCHADSLNAHSATLGVRAVVELFKAVNRLHEIDRWVLAFSVSHNHREVRIYGHYADFEDGDIRYYCHPICMFDFMHHSAEEVFTTNRFIQND
ncbi:protein kinase-like protein [Pochonia chlamydosporia 170]|uniref:Protein kinase-like protein n=1 Tax=Pochonia chlamydosporia 170 TaxID=1380566 RepID=A0A179FR40_METCM|nr:protein kinase-like protein [Pochonia chlamydosporia 170]OAQ68096.2 protein kinase-like protein [Pochonia chlamydosporia 170]